MLVPRNIDPERLGVMQTMAEPVEMPHHIELVPVGWDAATGGIDMAALDAVLAIVHGLDLQLQALSGMDQFVFQAGGGAHAGYTHCCVSRACHASRGELGQRNQIITTIPSHPCNPATAAAGFEVVTLMIEENGYPSLDALKAAVSDRTAALMFGNHAAGGLCFWDHANFNGVMGRVGAAELGFAACMFMLHKTFGAPKGGNGLAKAADLSVLANNCMDRKLTGIRGRTRSHEQIDLPRMKMTRWSLGRMKEEAGFGTLDVQSRMVDFGVDDYWLSHEPFTPEAGELWSVEDLDYRGALGDDLAGLSAAATAASRGCLSGLPRLASPRAHGIIVDTLR